MKNNLKVERARRNWTQEDLAKKIAVSRQTILSIETGRYIPSTILALKLADAFGLKVEDVFQLEEGD